VYTIPITTISAQDANAGFFDLLKRVEAGEAITITQQGTPVARLIPTLPSSTPESRQAAILAMRQLASQHWLAGLSVRSLLAEGRR